MTTILLVSNNHYHLTERQVGVTFRFPRELAYLGSHKYSLLAFGTLVEGQNNSELNIVDDPRIMFTGSRGTTIRSWLLHLPITIRLLWNSIGRSDVVILKLFYLNTLLAYPMTVIQRKPYIVMMVGDSPKAFRHKMRDRRLIDDIGSRVISAICRLMVNTSTTSWFVSSSLTKYARSRQPYFIANESTVLDQSISTSPRILSSARRLLFVGRLVKLKNVDLLVRAMADPSISMDYHLTIMGDGPERAAIIQLVDTLGLTSRVHFVGHIADRSKVQDIYLEHDLLVLPSSSEGLPLVLIEAMATGMPVIATPVGGVPELVQDGKNGLIVDDFEPHSIARSITSVFASDDKYRSLSEGAIETAKRNTVERQMQVVADHLLPLLPTTFNGL